MRQTHLALALIQTLCAPQLAQLYPASIGFGWLILDQLFPLIHAFPSTRVAEMKRTPSVRLPGAYSMLAFCKEMSTAYGL